MGQSEKAYLDHFIDTSFTSFLRLRLRESILCACVSFCSHSASQQTFTHTRARVHAPIQYKGVRVLPDNQDQTKEQRNPKKTSKMGVHILNMSCMLHYIPPHPHPPHPHSHQALLFHILFYGSIICSVFEAVCCTRALYVILSIFTQLPLL